MRPIARLAAALLLCSSATAEPATLALRDGTLTGTAQDGITSFRAIPYAAPPEGALRWRPPQPVSRWQGVRDALAFGPDFPQVANARNRAPRQDEDCLYKAYQERVAYLEKKIQTKDEVLAELMVEHIALKKTLGEL